MEIQLWREILSPYEQAVTELVEKFQHLSLEHRERGLYSPIEQVTGRVKSITSILEKMKQETGRSFRKQRSSESKSFSGTEWRTERSDRRSKSIHSCKPGFRYL